MSNLGSTDVIILFNLAGSSRNSVAQASKEAEYSLIISRLKAVGLSVTTRLGAKHAQQLLVCVKAKDKTVFSQLKDERVNDWIHGLSTEPPHGIRDLNSSPTTSSERLRLVNAMIGAPLTSSTAGIVPLSAEFPSVQAIFPPHDKEFNEAMKTRWMTSDYWKRGIPAGEVDLIRSQFGENVAFYFAFIRWNIRTISIPAAIGVLFWVSGISYSPIYSLLLVLWAIFFTESWRIQEQDLAIRWITSNCQSVLQPRKEFLDRVVSNERATTSRQETDQNEAVDGAQDWIKVLQRHLATFPIVGLFLLLLSTLVTAIYLIETITLEVYQGPLKQVVSLIPTVLFIGLVPRFTIFWHSIARALTCYENPTFTSEFESALTLKLFTLTFVASYLGLALTTFFYIPFGPRLLPELLSFLPAHSLMPLSADRQLASFTASTARLRAQMVSYTMTGQLSGAFSEFVLPSLTRFISKEVVKVQEKRNKDKEKNGVDDDLPEEKEWLERVREESQLPAYDVSIDHLEMGLQFGYVVLWSSIWSLAPMMSWINNLLEIRTDAFKLLYQTRRPIPSRSDTIGPWLEVLSFLTYAGAIVNAALVFLLRPRLVEIQELVDEKSIVKRMFKSRIETTSFDTFDPFTSFVQAILFIVVISHTFVIVRSAMRFLLRQRSKANSKGGEREVQRNLIRLRKDYLDILERRAEEEEEASSDGIIVVEAERKDQHVWEGGEGWVDKGLEEIRRVYKVD